MNAFRTGLLVAIYCLGLMSLGCDRVSNEMATKPDIKFIDKGWEQNLIADNECWADVRNKGASGYVTFKFAVSQT